MVKLCKSCPISNLKSIVGPASKLHLTVLVVKREPSDVNWTGGFENTFIIRFYSLEVFHIKKCFTGRDVGALPSTGHHHVGLVSRVERFAGAETTNISVVTCQATTVLYRLLQQGRKCKWSVLLFVLGKYFVFKPNSQLIY